MRALEFDRVEVRGLVKVYGPTRALIGVDASFEAGAVTAVEGPNGSGKSTLLSILAQLMRATRGEVMYGAHDGNRAGMALRAAIGVLAHAPMIYPDLSGIENLRLFASLHGASDKRAGELAERFEIGAWGTRPSRTYSRGQLQRVALARALVHSPRLLLLDEPSTGLDTASTERLVSAVEAEKERGAIVVLITHDEALADRLAQKRVRLERGRVVQ
jgi:ABC-type multidrug transport system ATPase subunit